jgi:hypothetical protein
MSSVPPDEEPARKYSQRGRSDRRIATNHGGVAGSDKEESAGLGEGSAPVDGRNRKMVGASLAGVAGNTDNLSRTGSPNSGIARDVQ